ncbi:MAG: serine hydrolase, partial [Chloroflexi bacterium]|nr:serine hydrolase [Chloroflexota bacterium]
QWDTLTLYPGQEERRLDLEASLPVVERALLSIDGRVADLAVERKPPLQPELSVLRDLLKHRIDQFVGLVGLYLTDLGSGQRLEINSDTVYSGMSIVKVGIMVTTLIDLNGVDPDEDIRNYMLKIAIDPVGSNYWANLLLGEIGDGSQTLGAQRTTQTLRALGLMRTFIRSPYHIETGYRPLGLARALEVDRLRPANQSANPDPFIQTSPHDIGTLLEMIYYCAQGRGPLMEIYPGQITPSGCQLILDVLKENPVRPWLGSGIPAEISLAHKHGFLYDTIGDAGIVYSSGGDYVLSVFVYANTDWLGCGAQPIFFDISRLVYAFFNLESGLWSPPSPECGP